MMNVRSTGPLADSSRTIDALKPIASSFLDRSRSAEGVGVAVREGIATVGRITAPGENVGVGVGVSGVGDGVGVKVEVGSGVGVRVGVCVGVGMAVGTMIAAGSGGKGVRVGNGVAEGGTGVGVSSSEQAAAKNSTAATSKKTRNPIPRLSRLQVLRFLARHNRVGRWGQYRGDRMALSSCRRCAGVVNRSRLGHRPQHAINSVSFRLSHPSRDAACPPGSGHSLSPTMNIRDILDTKRTLSFEYFPPRDEAAVQSVFDTIEALKEYRPDFIDITYGAGGSTRELTVEMAVRARHKTGLNVMAHITCSAQTEEAIHAVLTQLDDAGIENLIALRGDPPADQSAFVPVRGGFAHATDLILHVKKNFEFGIAAACYPESHPESPDPETDMKFTKLTVETAAEFLISQLFYDNDDFYAFTDRAARAGIDVPIIPGLMPILSSSQIRRITDLCGASIPPELDRSLEEGADDRRAVRQVGIEHTTRQARDLLDNGVSGLHFYVLNRSYSMIKILNNLRDSGHLSRLS